MGYACTYCHYVTRFTHQYERRVVATDCIDTRTIFFRPDHYKDNSDGGAPRLAFQVLLEVGKRI